MRLNPTLAVAALALLPAALSLTASAGGDRPVVYPKHIGLKHRQRPGGDSEADARARVLAALPTDDRVLINITGRELPASPDILALGRRSGSALERCLSDNADSYVKQVCASLLGRIGDRRALPALHTALEDWDPEVRRAVVRAVADLAHPSSFDALAHVWARKDEEPATRLGVLEALGAIGSPRAVQILRKELRRGGGGKGKKARARAAEDDEEDDGLGAAAHAVAFRALWKSRHLCARPTLVDDVAFALGSDDAMLVRLATLAAAELRAPKLAKPLIALVQHPDAEVRNKAVHALGKIGDQAATKALLDALPRVREARMLNNLAFALERLDRGAFFGAITRVVEHKQAIIRLNAAFVLGDVRRPEGEPLLRKLLDDPSDLVKTSAVVALGKLGRPAVLPALERFVDHPNLALREEAIFAVHGLSGGKRGELLFDKLFSGKHEGARKRAALALGEAGDPRVRDWLIDCFEARRCGAGELGRFFERTAGDTELAGRVLLAWARGRLEVGELVAKLRPPGTLTVAESALPASLARHDRYGARHDIDLLGDLAASLDEPSKARIARTLRERLEGADVPTRLRTEVTLVRLGDVEAGKALLGELDALAHDHLPALARAMARASEPEVARRLDPQLAERAKAADVAVALAAASVRLRWDPERAIFRFLEALASPSVMERELAEVYLRRARDPKVTWLLRRALAREPRDDVRDRLRDLVELRREG